MKQYNCIIIEDEPLAAEILKDYISDIPLLNLVGIHHDAISALSYLNDHPIDLIFLDINLPKLKGLDFLKSLRKYPDVIITTAYEEYALKSYDYQVTDYLLKPIEFSRFLIAVNKFIELKKSVNHINTDIKENNASMHFNVNKKLVKVFLNDILYMESQKDYLHIHTMHKKIITKMQINEIEKLLNKDHFIRIHRSFIISIPNVESISLTQVELFNQTIPVGRNYREIVKSTWNL